MATNYGLDLDFEGLGTMTLPPAPSNGMYYFKGKMSLPIDRDSDPSALVVVVNKNAGAQYTGIAGASGFECQFLCAAGDALTIVFSSAAAIDQFKNAIKAEIVHGLIQTY